MSKVKLFEVNCEKPIEKIEIGDHEATKSRIFYNFFSKPGVSQIDVSKENYAKDNNAKIFYFSGMNTDTTLTVGEVELIILGLQSMVDNVKK